jgi:type I restriction enzyme M protein
MPGCSISPNGVAGFVLANGSMSSNQSGEGEIRKALVEADLVDCMIALPGQLFYTTQIPACLWFLSRSKTPSPLTGEGRGRAGSRDRRGQVLFIDARKLASLVDRTHRDLSDDELVRIAHTHHAWRAELPSPSRVREAAGWLADGRGAGGEVAYEDVPGFCKSATLEEIASHGYVLTPGRYVGAEEAEDDDEPFDEKVKRLTIKLDEQFRESAQLEQSIRENLLRLKP